METGKKTLKCYLDTSVFNFALADRWIEEQRATLEFIRLSQKGEFETYISSLVIDEIAATPDEGKRKKLFHVLNNLQPIEFPLDASVESLVSAYLAARIIPEKARNDAIHIAAATVSNLDIIVSWNQEHMVKVKTRIGINAVNKLNGYKEIEIATPREVIP